MKKKIIILLSALFLLVAASGFILYSYSSYQKSNEPLIFPKGSTYEKEWEKVEEFAQKGLPKSALKVVEAIYNEAKKENNAPQFVKAIIHKLKYKMAIEDDANVKIINELNEEIKQSAFPVKPVLQSMLADMCWMYYQNNRWKFYNRTETINFERDDISTWDLTTLINEVAKNYNLSLSNADSLKRTYLNLYAPVIIRHDTAIRKFRPALYDFLAHRAVDFFINDESEVTKPVFQFQLDAEEYFANAKDFVKMEITTKDTSSLKFHAIKILQELIEFHLDDENIEALVDVDLKRLKFVKNNSINPLKDTLYLTTLLELEKQSIKFPVSTEVSYEIASVYKSRGLKYNPLIGDNNKWLLKKAVETCEKAIKRFPKSYGAANCKYLIATIKAKNLSFQLETYNLPKKPFRALLKYKNTDSLYFRAIKVDRKKHKNKIRKLNSEEFINYVRNLEPVKEWKLTVENEGDYQQHSVEIKVPELEFGYYIMLVSPAQSFKVENNAIGYAYTTITNISYVRREKPDGSHDINIMHRQTGEPLSNVKATMWKEKYSYKSREYIYVKLKDYYSAQDGSIRIPPASNYRYFYIEFQKDNDNLYTNEYFYQYKPYHYDKSRIVSYFFTDRAIYRPGQTVYFKGIILYTDGERNEIRTNYSTTVTFYDVNYQKISDLKLVSNEYGTISGSFTAPKGVLTGQMHIQNESGSIYFSVEEYKRPKFEVKFLPVEGTYKLNQTVKVKGEAKAYAGSNIDGANVQYKVLRRTYFPYRSWYWGWFYPPYSSEEMVITYGTTITNEKGEFEIEFKAIPDLSVSKEWKPSFNYTVSADVTDINGETHSSEKSVYVGYTALLINTDLQEKINKDKTKKFKLNTTNLSGEFVPAKGDITVYKLKQKDKIFRKRLWEQPDKYKMSKQDYYKLFPYDIYKDEDSPTNLKKEKKVFFSTFDTKKNKEIVLSSISSWDQGKYFIEIKSKDKYGEDVKYENYFTVYSPEEKSVPVNSYDWFTTVKNQGEPGETAQFLIGSKDKNVKVLYEIEHKEKIVKKQWLNLSDEQKLIEIPIEEKHRGNFSVHFIFIKNSRAYSYNDQVYVPYTNKQLDISFSTFRNKLYPGQKEEWKIKIAGKDGEKVAAEMVATLYDASLDAFKPNYWYFSIYPHYYSRLNWQSSFSFSTQSSNLYQKDWNPYTYFSYKYYDELNWFGFSYYGGYYYSMGGKNKRGAARYAVATAMPEGAEETGIANDIAGVSVLEKEANQESKTRAISGEDADKTTEQMDGFGEALGGASGKDGEPPIKARKNFNETAFFYPHLETNEKGEVIISFTIPEALTRWKMMGFAHSKDLKYGLIDTTLITQKDLMVMPNIPRFLRENDAITLTSKVTNLSKKDLTGTAQLYLYDALTMKPIDDKLKNTSAKKSFTVKKGLSTNITWDISIPEGIQAVTYKVIAQSGKFSDGEENTIPVLTNRMLVTESMPLPVRSKQTKNFKFKKLINSGESTTLRHHKVTLEFTANPAWYAVQALPYLMEFPYECTEQVFSRYYANSIASFIANSNPKIKRVFDSWKNIPDSKALLSNLEKNQELKSVLLEETPWVLDAQDESERKKRVGLLFDLNHMANNLKSALHKLEKMQTPNGGWTWFKGMPDDRYITQHIITGFGHLDHLGVKNVRNDKKVWNMVSKGVRYLDNRIRNDYEWIKKHYNKEEMKENHLGRIQIQYLYARSYFKDIQVSSRNKEAFNYFKGQAEKYWLENSKYLQGMIALALHRYGNEKVPMEIINSLKEHSLTSDEMGMYWKDNRGGYYWYQAPIETQALMIEAFDEVANDKKAVDDLRVWLLKQKQTQDWKTTKATTEAVYALLIRGTSWLSTEFNIEIKVGSQTIDPKKMPDVKLEAGTGYFKTSWSGGEITPEMGNVTVSKKDEGVSWGALYWQYFEQLDKITPHETPLKLKKRLFIERMTDTGKKIEPVSDKTQLKIGDKIIVRIELRVDRDMEYIHMKDMRASGFEPLNVISRYKYQDRLGYYESTRDVSTNFFISYLPKGTYVFEYPIRVTHKGDFSNGITTIQCMYAPEFASHSEGIRVKVGK